MTEGGVKLMYSFIYCLVVTKFERALLDSDADNFSYIKR